MFIGPSVRQSGCQCQTKIDDHASLQNPRIARDSGRLTFRTVRGWSVTITYMALVSVDAVVLRKDDSSEEVAWTPVDQLKKNNDLAFDHNKILESCHKRLKDKVRYTSLPVNLLPPDFTLTELQRIFEVILDKSVEKKSFRRRILDAQILEETGNFRGGSTRPAKLYRAVEKNTNHFFARNMEGTR